MRINTDSDFMLVRELAQRTGFRDKSIYTWHSANSGPLSGILCKVGGRLGCWRADYDLWVASQRRLQPPKPSSCGNARGSIRA